MPFVVGVYSHAQRNGYNTTATAPHPRILRDDGRNLEHGEELIDRAYKERNERRQPHLIFETYFSVNHDKILYYLSIICGSNASSGQRT